MKYAILVPPQADNRAKFRALMELHGVTNDEASALLGKKTTTILSYRTNNGVDISDQLLELFELKLTGQ